MSNPYVMKPTRCMQGKRVGIRHGMNSDAYRVHLHMCERCEEYHKYLVKLARNPMTAADVAFFSDAWEREGI